MSRTHTPQGGRTLVPGLDRDGGIRSLVVVAAFAALFPVALWAISHPTLLAAAVGGAGTHWLARTLNGRRATGRTRRVCVPGTDVCTRI